MEKPKILIVDDEAEQQMAIMNVIAAYEQEYDVLSAFDGQKGLEIALNEAPDLIISDWEMPVMDGIEFIKKLKKDNKTTDIPVIMCTGIMISSENLQTALLAGAVDYVRKPIDKIELIARINANLHLADKYNEIKMLNKTKDKIFSVISHDLRGPVGTTKSFMDLILSNLNNCTTDELKNFIGQLSKQSGSLYTILENLLLWANSQQKNVTSKPVKQLVMSAVKDNILLLEASANKKNILLQNNIPDDLIASFDNNLISTVIRNLINNAIKFTSKGGIVSLNAEVGEQFHTIIVSDTGIGISQKRAGKIFNKTYYETTEGTDKEKGSGLGLKLCLDFVELNDGKIWVESEVGKGSKFCFTLPVDAS
jgi:signal transduction histidine kinase